MLYHLTHLLQRIHIIQRIHIMANCEPSLNVTRANIYTTVRVGGFNELKLSKINKRYTLNIGYINTDTNYHRVKSRFR